MSAAEFNTAILQSQADMLVQQTNLLNEYRTLVGSPADALLLVNNFAAALAEVRRLKAKYVHGEIEGAER